MARILITGSNSGFGLLSTLTLARQGHDVIATMRNPAKSEALDDAVAAGGLSVTKRTLDVADQASVDAALTDADDVDVLINNAGYEVQSSVEQLTDDLMYDQLETNVMGPLRTMRAVLPSWRARGTGPALPQSPSATAQPASHHWQRGTLRQASRSPPSTLPPPIIGPEAQRQDLAAHDEAELQRARG